MTHKFRQGDTVRVLQSDWPEFFPVGSKQTISRVYNKRTNSVVLHHAAKHNSTGDYLFYASEVELAVEEPTEPSNFTLAEPLDIPVTKPLHITYCGVTITLDAHMQSSRMFAEKLLDIAYGKVVDESNA